jgi:hypothetical protein
MNDGAGFGKEIARLSTTKGIWDFRTEGAEHKARQVH